MQLPEAKQPVGGRGPPLLSFYPILVQTHSLMAQLYPRVPWNLPPSRCKPSTDVSEGDMLGPGLPLEPFVTAKWGTDLRSQLFPDPSFCLAG